MVIPKHKDVTKQDFFKNTLKKTLFGKVSY